MKNIIYVASPESQQIHVLKMNDKGMLTLLQIIDIPGYGQPMVIHPANTNLYVGIRPNFGVINYHIDSKGLLTEIGMVSLPGSPTYLAIDLTGTTLYSASYLNNCISLSLIDKQGVISLPYQVLEGVTSCHSVNIDNNNQIVWVPCLLENRVRCYKNISGYLIPFISLNLDGLINKGPRHMAFHYKGNYAYIINEISGTVNVIIINNLDGYLSITQTLDVVPSNITNNRWAADIHITPNNRWLYCCDRSSNIISRFAVSDDGSMLKLLGYQVTETQPRGFNIDSYGKFLVIAGQKSNYISVYFIKEKSGELLLTSRYAVGKGPMWISILSL